MAEASGRGAASGINQSNSSPGRSLAFKRDPATRVSTHYTPLAQNQVRVRTADAQRCQPMEAPASDLRSGDRYLTLRQGQRLLGLTGSRQPTSQQPNNMTHNVGPRPRRPELRLRDLAGAPMTGTADNWVPPLPF